MSMKMLLLNNFAFLPLVLFFIGVQSAPQSDFFGSQTEALEQTEATEQTEVAQLTETAGPTESLVTAIQVTPSGPLNLNQPESNTQLGEFHQNLNNANNESKGNANFQSLFTNLTGLPLDFVFMGSLEMANQSEVAFQPGNGTSSEVNCTNAINEAKSYKIVGGQEVEGARKYPWMAALRSNASFCTGSIISETKILTAKHCTYAHPSLGGREYVPSDITVSVGSIYLNAPNDVYHVQSIVRPPDGEMDFAILVLNASLPSCHPTIKPICLSETPSEDLDPGTVVTAMGWGRTSNDSMASSQTLKEAELSITTDAECNLNSYSDNNPDFFCAEYGTGGICHGDSGGPVVMLKDGKYFQIGVNSYGAKGTSCGEGVPLGFASTTTQAFIDLAKPFYTC